MRSNISNEKPIALYNADKQELIGVFDRPFRAAYFLFGSTVKITKGGHVVDAIHKKYRIGVSVFDFPVSARYANEDQVTLLGGKEYFITDSYIDTIKGKKFGFTDTRYSLWVDHTQRGKIKT
jgi:hypothetical protein